MIQIISDIVLSLFAVIGIFSIINEIGKLIPGKGNDRHILIVIPSSPNVDRADVTRITRATDADEYIIIGDTQPEGIPVNVNIVSRETLSEEVGERISALL